MLLRFQRICIVLLLFLGNCTPSDLLYAIPKKANLHAGALEEVIRSSRKYALIIAVGAYPKEKKYKSLRGIYTDARLMKDVLLKQGFEEKDIIIVLDQKATKQGILDAIATLTENVTTGDMVVIHYSGHGDRITDDDPNNPLDLELDGYDEALVPYGAPAGEYVRTVLNGNYNGEEHLRDDELNRALLPIRQKLGNTGHMFLTIDACHSGSVTRGEIVYRGSSEPIGMPARSASGEIEPQELDMQPNESILAPVVALFASNYNQLAAEILYDGVKVGALSLALSKTLLTLDASVSYEALYQKVSTFMQSLPEVMQTPQMEGNKSLQVFNGNLINQQPYFVIKDVAPDNTLTLEGGMLVGITEGSEVEIYPFGTIRPEKEKMLAKGKIVESSALESWIDVENTSVKLDEYKGAWVFLTNPALQKMNIGVHLDTDKLPILADSLKQYAFITLNPPAETEINHHLVIEKTETGINIQTLNGQAVLENIPTSEGTSVVVKRVLGFARNQFLRALEINDATVNFALKLIPATMKFNRRGQYVGYDSTGVVYPKEGANLWKLNPMDTYVLRIQNTGKMPAYFTVLSLMPDGQIDIMFPDKGESDIRLFPGGQHEIPLRISADAKPGLEMLKLIATNTSRPLDLRSVMERNPTFRNEGLQPLEALLEESFTTRSDRITGSSESATTASILIQINQSNEP